MIGIQNPPDLFAGFYVVAPAGLTSVGDHLHGVAHWDKNRSAVGFAHISTIRGDSVFFIIVQGSPIPPPECFSGILIEGNKILLVRAF